MRFTNLVGLLLILLLAGCGPKTTLILLPQKSGEVGEVVIKTEGGEVVISSPYSYSSVSSSGILPTLPRDISPEEVKLQYGYLLAAQPPGPVSYILYFKNGSTDLTEESRKLLHQMRKAVVQVLPTEVSIIGHTDSVGDKESNNLLSLKRAKHVEGLLLDVIPSLKNITIKSHGENDPLIATPDNVSEPKNRRVEIMIR